MNRRTTLFVAVVSVSSLGITAHLLGAYSVASINARDAVGILSFLVMGIMAERMAISFGSGRQATSSLAFLPFISSILLFSPAVSVLAVASVVGIGTVFFTKLPPSKILFNVSQAIIAAAVGSLLYSLSLPPEIRLEAVRTHINYLAFPVAALGFLGANLILTSVAIALLRSQDLRSTLIQVAGPRGANLWYDLLASPIALFPVALYPTLFVAAMAIVLLPLMLIRYSYLSKLQLEHANRDLLSVLVKAIETRDPYTSGHSMRVATLARLIAEDLVLPRNRVDEIERAALLHDIGKIDLIYAGLLRKPYDLSSDERTLIQTHATKGADLLESLRSVSPEVIRGVRHHHERYDGSGYPAGLTGESIPISGRIIMLCDSIDAMLSDRPYRQALSVTRVRGELVRCAGMQFDPSIVQVILQRNTLERAVNLVARSADATDSQPSILVAV